MTIKDKVLSKTLQIKNGKLLRNVEDISSIKKLIKILEKKGYINKFIVETKIYSEEEKLIEHEILPYIIHSGEYTESMAYDSTLASIDMAIDLVDEKVYAYDLFPHNYTLHNGVWFLYDFDSFQLKPEKVITEIRGFFKIIFSNYEILKLISREKLGHYYLTRYKIEDIRKMIPFSRWLYLFGNQVICNILCIFKQNKLVYLYLKKLFNEYSKNHKKNYIEYVENPNNKIINEILIENNINAAFCIGDKASNFAIFNEQNNSKTTKVVYLEDYKYCDDYYNYVMKEGYKNIIPAVLYPVLEDEEIENNLRYRALYDSYNQERFYSEAVICLDKNIENKLLEILCIYTEKILVINKENNIEKLKTVFECVEIKGNYIVAQNKYKTSRPLAKKRYLDGNRGIWAIKQSNIVGTMLKKD